MLQNLISPAKAAVFVLHDHSATLEQNLRTVLAMNPRVAQFVNVVQVTPVKTAAKHKARRIFKVSRGNYYVSTSMETYTNAVKNSAAKRADNDAEAIENFQTRQAWYEHDSECAAIGRHRQSKEPVLCYFFKQGAAAKSEAYYVDADTGTEVTLQQVAELLTPAECDKLLNPPKETHNKGNDITHDVGVRAVYLKNIAQVTANKQTITV